jgi:geranylgeranyl diphosphate synthase, type I
MTDTIDISQIQAAIEEELKECILHTENDYYAGYEEIFTYQMDWEDSPHVSRGKRVRPLLLLLAVHAVGGDWHAALPAAASLELMHNFSLIHDDIQDQSPTRRGKPTIWVKWGEPLAINAGDALLALSSLALQRLKPHFSPEQIMQISKLVHHACLDLTRGQYLDISFETRPSVSLDEYIEMITGKTCSLLSAALEIGGRLGGASEQNSLALNKCGLLLGQAYQIQDDWLGIWGNDAITGKSNQSDLITRKKTFPILSGLAKKRTFFEVWSNVPVITCDQIHLLVETLKNDGAKSETEAKMESLYLQTQTVLDSMNYPEERMAPLRSSINKLMKRAQ